jgi:hypothetical protein
LIVPRKIVSKRASEVCFPAFFHLVRFDDAREFLDKHLVDASEVFLRVIVRVNCSPSTSKNHFAIPAL